MSVSRLLSVYFIPLLPHHAVILNRSRIRILSTSHLIAVKAGHRLTHILRSLHDRTGSCGTCSPIWTPKSRTSSWCVKWVMLHIALYSNGVPIVEIVWASFASQGWKVISKKQVCIGPFTPFWCDDSGDFWGPASASPQVAASASPRTRFDSWSRTF
jgi:hypothetical protein